MCSMSSGNAMTLLVAFVMSVVVDEVCPEMFKVVVVVMSNKCVKKRKRKKGGAGVIIEQERQQGKGGGKNMSLFFLDVLVNRGHVFLVWIFLIVLL